MNLVTTSLKELKEIAEFHRKQADFWRDRGDAAQAVKHFKLANEAERAYQFRATMLAAGAH